MKVTRQTASTIQVIAPAKVNLFLEVLGKRPDGYHEIETLMVEVDLYDTLSFHTAADDRLAFTCGAAGVPENENNLVVRAARALMRAAGVSNGLEIRLDKAIPAQAGLGGGSSDAAATLLALHQLWGLSLSRQSMEGLAADLGSDVAFFLSGPAAVCRGRGEQVEPIREFGKFHIVIVSPPVGSSTAEVYRHLQVPEEPRSIEPVLEGFRQGDPRKLGRHLFNRLQDTAQDLQPELGQVFEAMTSLGSLFEGCLMSGSGSTYFGLARDRDAAETAARKLEALGPGEVRVVTCGP